ncbi:MAG: GUN4 domain-containing protein [Limnospira sp.]
MVTVYGTLKNVDLIKYLGSNSKGDVVAFYGDLLGVSGQSFKEKKLYRGYIKDIEISVNPETLEIYALPNSLCEEAIETGDRLKIDDLNREIEDDRIRKDAQFTTFRNQIQVLLNDGFGIVEVVDIAGRVAIVEINLLRAERNCYRKSESIQALEKMLKNQNWKEADIKTHQILLEAGDRSQKGYLDIESIRNFPCADLKVIDRLWRDASGEKFGFKTQQVIYSQTGNELAPQNLRKYDLDSYVHFIDLVRWIETGSEDGQESWRPYDKLTFSLEAPEGHLPRLHDLERGLKIEESGFKLNSPNSLPLTTQEIQARHLIYSRVEACEL